MLLNSFVTVAEGATGVASVTTAVTNALTLAGTTINFCLDQPILCMCIGGAMAAVGFKVFKKARRSVGF